MVIKHNREKLFNLIIYFARKTKHCGITKLFKLLFFADFKAFKETGVSVTGLNYYTWPKGPAPVELHNEFKTPSPDFQKTFSVTKLDPGDRLNIQPKHGVKFDSSYFSKKELQIIEQLAYIYADVYAKDIVEITHLKNSPWDRTVKEKGMNKLIDYKLAFDSDKDSLSPGQYEEISETQQIMDSILSRCKKAK